ncbi:MAG: hypothetical protein GWP08_18745 [Nitrospiraceae bacterium]|nr:hypothetical protein [Nitrospiraceae bacterium]
MLGTKMSNPYVSAASALAPPSAFLSDLRVSALGYLIAETRRGLRAWEIIGFLA